MSEDQEKSSLAELHTQLPPNQELVGELERLLAWAKKGTLVGLATVSYWNTKNTGTGWHFPSDGVDIMRVQGAAFDLCMRLRDEINSHPENFDDPPEDA